MSTWKLQGQYDFSIPEAQWLSDLNGIETDLDAADRLCRRFMAESTRLSKLPDSDHEAWIEDFLAVGDTFFSAVVRYGRTFTSGTRSGIPGEWIDALSPQLQEAHLYFKTLRDKFIAHSVNRLEDNHVFAILQSDEDGMESPTHITVERGRVMTPSHEEVESLRHLVTALKVRIASEIKTETTRLLRIAQSMPIEELKARGTDTAPIPNKSDTYRVRNRFK